MSECKDKPDLICVEIILLKKRIEFKEILKNGFFSLKKNVNFH